MKALSIRQPWADLILKYGKDIENRDWPTKMRGRILIHAAKGCTKDEFEDAMLYARAVLKQPALIDYHTMQRGGIIGAVTITDCVTKSDSPWFMGEYGFVLQSPNPIVFLPWRGQLGFFDVPNDVMLKHAEATLPNK